MKQYMLTLLCKYQSENLPRDKLHAARHEANIQYWTLMTFKCLQKYATLGYQKHPSSTGYRGKAAVLVQ